MIVRHACKEDCAAIGEIYNHAVLHTAAIWNDKTVDTDNRIAWFEARSLAGYPVLVSEEDGVITGYASFGDWRAFDGFRHTVEHSVYVHPAHQGKGIGRTLMKALINEARAIGKHVMVAGIEAQNHASIHLHETLGFVNQVWPLAGLNLYAAAAGRAQRPGRDPMNQSLTLAFLVAAGIGLVVQNTLMVRITQSSSTILIAMLLNSLVGIVLFVSILLLKQGVAGFSELAATVRWWTLIPGLLGSFFVFASISGYQNVGAATTIAVLVASQLIGGLVLDVLRSQGIPLRALIGPVCGAVMLVVGAWLVARRQF